MTRLRYARTLGDGLATGCYFAWTTSSTGKPLEKVAFVERLDTPVQKLGNTYRWRAWFDGKWLLLERRKDLERYV